MRYLPLANLIGGGAPAQPKPTAKTAQPVATSSTSSGAWLKWVVVGVAAWILLEVFA